MTPSIAIVGKGKMGTAIFHALKKNFPSESLLTICDRGTDLNEFLREVEVVIIAIKPQDFDLCADSIKIDLSSKIILSIMAGISIDSIKKHTGAKKVVRSMPNLPLQVEAGITAWTTSPELTEKDTIKEIFECFGSQFEVDDESKLDAITALSGSGPAYFFYLCELLTEQAEEFGFSQEESRMIAEQTFLGAAKLLEENESSAKEWKEAITSKGGTTEAALNHLQSEGFDSIFKAAIQAANDRFKK